MDDQIRAMMEHFVTRQQMRDQFMQELVTFIALGSPADGEVLLERLYQVQERMGSPAPAPNSTHISHEELRLRTWREMIDLAERGVQTARELRDREPTSRP